MKDVTAMRRSAVAEAIRRHRLVCILRRIEPQARLMDLVDELAADGARIFEITWDAPAAAEDLAAVRERLALATGEGFLVGAGTLFTGGQLEAAIAAGADFGVSPVLDAMVLDTAIGAGLPFVPGGATPTEVRAAWSAGATFVKLFPASALGPPFVRELRGPMPEVELIPTGGVEASTAPAYLAAGAAAVGIGSALSRMDGAARRSLIATLAGSA